MGRKQFQRLPNISEQHNEVHRKTYDLPYLLRKVSTYPTDDEMDMDEMLLCMNSSTSAICIKVNDSAILSAGLT